MYITAGCATGHMAPGPVDNEDSSGPTHSRIPLKGSMIENYTHTHMDTLLEPPGGARHSYPEREKLSTTLCMLAYSDPNS